MEEYESPWGLKDVQDVSDHMAHGTVFSSGELIGDLLDGRLTSLEDEAPDQTFQAWKDWQQPVRNPD